MPANKVRIIGGTLRHRLIQFPADPLLRPTPDRVRETLFNWLGQTLDGLDCLDLFAGSGALGFEAWSRGAKHVVVVEQARPALAALKRNAETLAAPVEIFAGDAARFLRDDRRSFDVVFFDPPFQSDAYARLWPALERHVGALGRVYVESPQPFQAPGWQVSRVKRAGQVYYQLLARITDADEGSGLSGTMAQWR